MATFEIPLTKGKVAIVDECDYANLISHRWFAFQRGLRWHAARTVKRNGSKRTVYMHRAILDATTDYEVDHRDGDGLNNTRDNLRVCTHAENSRNAKRQLKYKTSAYHGVSWLASRSRWRAVIVHDGRQTTLGTHRNEIDAARAYDRAAAEAFGEFASPNFPRGEHAYV